MGIQIIGLAELLVSVSAPILQIGTITFLLSFKTRVFAGFPTIVPGFSRHSSCSGVALEILGPSDEK